MSRALILLNSESAKAKAVKWIAQAPWNTRIEFKAPRRSLPQNDRMWAMLTDIAQQTLHQGLKLSADDWKLLFLDALKREVRLVQNLDGNGMVSLGRSSSDLSKEEMSDLIEILHAWGAARGVTFHDTQAAEAA